MSTTKKRTKNIRYLKRIQTVKKYLLVIIIIAERLNITKTFSTFFNLLLSGIGINKNVLTYSNYRRFGVAFKDAFRGSNTNHEKVLFPMMFGNNSNFNLINLLFAKYLKGKGLNPVFLVCNSTFNICGRERIGKQRKGMPLFCYECYGGYSKLSQLTGIDLDFMTNFYNESLDVVFKKEKASINALTNIDECLNYKLSNGFNIGLETKKRILKYFFRSTLTGDPEEVEVYKKYLIDGAKYYLIMLDYLSANKEIKKIILHNGTLSYGNYLFHIAKQKKIDIITYETYLGNNSIVYKKNDEVMKLSWTEEMSKFFETNPFLETNKLFVDKFFEGLQKGKDMYAVLNKEHDLSTLSEVSKYVCLFTNLNFDTSVLDRNTIFASMENWIYEVIDFWQENNIETTLVIRVHPAELKLITPSSDFIGEKIRKRIKNPNVILIDADQKINSYRLIEKMEFGLVYSSTIGLEATYANKVCIVAGDPFYKDENFVITPQTKANYFKTINNLLEGGELPIIDRDSLYRFVYFLYFVRIKKLKGFHIQFRGKIESNKIDDYSQLIKENRDLLEEFYNECIV